MRIAIAVAFACGLGMATSGANAQDLVDFDPLRGVGGYEGAIEPITRPVILRWRARPAIIGTVETVSVLGGSEPERMTTVFTGAVSDRRGGVMRRFSVSELTVGDRRITARTPLVVVESWSDPQGGNVGDLSIAFPGFEERGLPVPPEGTPQFQVWQDLFAADLAYAPRPVRSGDSVFDDDSYRNLLEGQVRGILADPSAKIIENTYVTVARGVTQVGGRVHVAAELSGRIVARSGGNELTMMGAGFGLIDVENGLATGTSRTEVIARQGGREVRRTVFVDVRLLQ